MSKKYLLPCPKCGQRMEVDSSRIGLTLPCACGNTLEVPTLRALRDLEPVPEATATVGATAWGPRQGLLFVGLVLLICSTTAAAIAWFYDPPKIPSLDLSGIRLEAEGWNLVQSFDVWEHVHRTPIEQPLYKAEQDVGNFFKGLEQRQTERLHMALLWLSFSGVGLVLCAVSCCLPSGKPTPGPVTAPGGTPVAAKS